MHKSGLIGVSPRKLQAASYMEVIKDDLLI